MGKVARINFNRATLIERYWDEGESFESLGWAYGLSRHAMYRVFIRLEIPRRPRGNRPLDGRWCEAGWKKCRICERTEIPHHAHGLCKSCSSWWYEKGSPEIEEWIEHRSRSLRERRLYG